MAATELPPNGLIGTTLIYDRVDQAIQSYRLGPWGEVSRTLKAGYSQYAFQPATAIFTTGPQTPGPFRIISIDGNEITTLATTPANEAIFPLAAQGSLRLFVTQRYAQNAKRLADTGAVRLETDGALTSYPKVIGAQAGTIVGGRLFYTTYVRSTDSYDLYVTSALDPSATPTLVRRGLEDEALFAHDGHVLTYSHGRIVGHGRPIPCDDPESCEFDDAGRVFLQIKPDEDSRPEFLVTDPNTGRSIATVRHALAYDVRPGHLTVYRERDIKTVLLPAP